MHIKDLYTPHLIKRQRGRVLFFNRWLAVFLIFIALVAGGVAGWIVIFSPFSIRLRAAEYFILTLGVSQTLDGAETISAAVRAGGGGGYIINDGEFLITAAAYSSFTDAETVRERMAAEWNASIITVTVPRGRIPRFEDRRTDRQARQIIEYPLALIDIILHQNLRLDLADTTESAVLLMLMHESETLLQNKRALENLLTAFPDSEVLISALAFFTAFAADFTNTISITNTDGSLTHRLKYFACMYINAYAYFRARL